MNYKESNILTMNYKECIDFDTLYLSMIKCKKNVLWKDSVAHYYLNGINETLKLSNKLKSGTFESRNPYTFTIFSPKRRDIVSVSFRDRVYQRSLNDNNIYPIMSKSFIYDNCACQIGKGTDFARNRLKHFLHKFYNKNKNTGYVLQIDIHGYYPNMSHELIENLFKNKLSNEMYKSILEILHKQYIYDIGYNPGSQLIQIAGIAALDKLDHYIKEKLKIKYYLRYMDDSIILNESKEYLEYCLKQIKMELNKIGFEVNPGKTRIYKITDKIPFLGFNFNLTKTGKVLMIIKPSKIKQVKKHLKHLVKRSKNNKMTKQEVDTCFKSCIAFIKKGNSYNTINKLKAYYNNLWRK